MLNFGLAQHHKWSITEIEDMIPFERDLYVDLLKDYLEKEEQRLKATKNGRR
jgi:hypothetical protein